MEMSESTSALFGALASAQGEIEDATKAGLNPHFKSKYADLASVRAVIRAPLTKHGLAIIQLPRAQNGIVEVETMLTHKSGEFIKETLRMPVGQMNAHGIGSAITYARRYGLMSMLCIAADDDDGNAATMTTPAFNRAMKAEKDFV